MQLWIRGTKAVISTKPRWNSKTDGVILKEYSCLIIVLIKQVEDILIHGPLILPCINLNPSMEK